MTFEEMDKYLVENEFARISFDTWIYRLDYVNAYLSIGDSINLNIQNVGTNLVFISKSVKLPSDKFTQAVALTKNVSESLNKEISIFVSRCSLLLSKEIENANQRFGCWRDLVTQHCLSLFSSA